MKTDYELIGWDAGFGSKSNFVFSVCGHQTTFMFTRTRGALKENHIEAALDTDIGFGGALLIILCCKEHLSVVHAQCTSIANHLLNFYCALCLI